MPVQAKPISADKDTTPLQLAGVVGNLFSDLADQLNAQTALYYTASKDPTGLKEGDLLIRRTGSTIALFVRSSSSKFDPVTLADLDSINATLSSLQSSLTALSSSTTASLLLKLNKNSTDFLGLFTNTSSGITNFPTSGNWGFQNNAGTLSINFNVSGTVKKVALV